MILERQTIKLFEREVFERVVVKPPFKYTSLAKDKACFFHVLQGTVNSYSGKEYFKIEENEGVLVKCGNFIFERMAKNDTENCNIIAIHLHNDVLKKIYEKDIPGFFINKKELSNQSNLSLIKSNVQVKKYIDSILFYFDNPSLIHEELLIVKVKELLLLLMNTKEATTIVEILENLFSENSIFFKEVIESHVFSPISIADLALLTNNSLATFKRKFNKIYQDSPANYIRNRRLEKAANLLSISNEPIGSIAYNCQFNNISHFSTSFKVKYNFSPLQYRLSQKQK